MTKRPVADRIYRFLLRLFPFDFQREFGTEMEETFRQQRRHAERSGITRSVRLWWDTVRGFLMAAAIEHLDVLRRDVRYSIRSLRKSPAFVVVAISALGIGIGANLTIFGFADALFFRPLPVPQAKEVIQVFRDRWANIPYEDYIQYRERNESVQKLAIYQTATANMQLAGTPEAVLAMAVSGNYFESLRIQAVAGRTITETDDKPGAPGVIMLGNKFWRRLGSDPSILGRTVSIDGQPFTVIGLTPESFNGTMSPFLPDIWIPWNGPHRSDPSSGPLIGRLRPGTSIAQAEADFGRIAASIAQERRARFSLTVAAGRLLHPEILAPAAAFAGILMGLASMALLIACLNIASLLLARSATRRREISVRVALGASRRQLVRQALTESLILSSAGGIAAFGLALAVARAVQDIRLPGAVPVVLQLDFAIDWRLAVFAIGLSVVTTLLFGLAPTWQSVRRDVAPALKELASTTALRKSRLRGIFIVGQLAVSAVLLIIASLLLRSLSSPQSSDRGFVSENIFVASLSPGNAGYTTEQGIEFFEHLLLRLEGAPNVLSANVAEIIPLTLSSFSSRYETDGSEPVSVDQNTVSRGHFRTLGLPLLEGRDFNAADTAGATPVGIVNERLARRLWPNESPIGKRLRSGTGPLIEIVGMARDSKYVGISEDPKLFLYRPIGQLYDPRAHQSLLIKTRSNPMGMLPVVRTAVDELDPALPIFGVASLDEATQISLLPARIAFAFAGALGIVAVLLAVIGIYGVVSYLARHRTREIGIRIALGARPSQVMRFVRVEAMRWTIFGLMLGLGAALGIAELAKDFLYGVAPTDPVSFGGIAFILTATTYAACWIPARRATNIDPTVALREE